ncbi:Predicted metalloprotease [Jatrophihabitans endophyticus]|uniref:Predicted metalloprotease n=2 Tax=Jatrophihabitans endophyticus TaxID=1206085 RepID=A0A1M5I8W3_9ACTN|nr:Predicted metalloprotease [Jatrophihabitans endophyticus]
MASLAAVTALALTGCNAVVDGTPTLANAPDAKLSVKGVDSTSSFDRVAQNALADIESFWRTSYPKVSGGKQLEPIKGGLYSVDGLKVAENRSADGQPVEDNACAERSIGFLVDNAAYCRLDDSIVWDRAPKHLFAELAKKYGDFVVALIFAHEFGHAVQERLGVFDDDPKTIYTESQADCAAGAWAKAATQQRAPHFRDITLAKVDDALEGFLNGRDSTPENIDDISHGNGFDRLSAVADGFDKGVTYCYSDGYFSSRTFTERPYNSPEDEASGGNTAFAKVVDTSANNPFVKDLNRFWTSAAQSIGKTFKPVKIAQAAHPKCGADASTEFGYCPDDNTVYFSTALAQRTYNSLPDVDVDRQNGNVTLLSNQPADFALGTMFSIGWGFAVRHQLFSRSLDGAAALQAGICYTGAYAKDINVEDPPGGFLLSPADLDEGVAALLDEVPQDSAFGARDTTGLQRIQSFIKGYKGGKSVC